MNNLTFKILKSRCYAICDGTFKNNFARKNITCFVFKIVTLFITIITINNYISYCVFVTAVQLHTFRLVDFCL